VPLVAYSHEMYEPRFLRSIQLLMCYLSPAVPGTSTGMGPDTSFGPRSSAGYWEAAILLPSSRPIICSLTSPLSGDEGTRTPDLLRAREALSQLSYIPTTVASR
jgi:hypothetical protein